MTYSQPWRGLAQRALDAALVDSALDDGDDRLAGAMMELIDTHGPQCVPGVLLFWVDRAKPPDFDEKHVVPALRYFCFERGRFIETDEMPAAPRWAGRLMLARWLDDGPQVAALMAAAITPDPDRLVAHLYAMVGMCAQALNVWGPVDLPPFTVYQQGDESIPAWTDLAGHALVADVAMQTGESNVLTLRMLQRYGAEIQGYLLFLWADIANAVAEQVRQLVGIPYMQLPETAPWVDRFLHARGIDDIELQQSIMDEAADLHHTAEELVLEFRHECALRIRRNREVLRAGHASSTGGDAPPN